MSADNQRTRQGREPSTDKKVGGEYEEQEFPGKGSSSTQGNQQGQRDQQGGQFGKQGQQGGQQGSFGKQNQQGQQGSTEEETDVEGRDRTRDKFSGEQE